ncbi:rCG23330 [Rattus norvegicus]|uniref:RCG23330 n=1 Tax=Rattus norvegicus TaxID=10116 RepID=A6JQ73_RAT|nr:rCG23330 [Rattus norvegicus]
MPVVHVGPVLPLLHDPARVPLAPLGHGGADDEGPGSGSARVSGQKKQ